MSDRYPQGTSAKWFSTPIYVHTVATRDVYGNVLTTTKIETTGHVRLSQIELIEAGARVKRQGARILVADRQDIDIDVGTVIEVVNTGKEYSVIGFTTLPDHQGNTHFWKCDTVNKATDQV